MMNQFQGFGTYGFNPYAQQPQNGYQRSENNLIRVTGIEGAKAYQMQPNSCTALFDGAEDYLYIKSTDGAGFPTIKTYRIEEVSGIQQPVQDYVTRAEFEDLRKDVGAYVKQYIQELKTRAEQPAARTIADGNADAAGQQNERRTIGAADMSAKGY